MDRIPDPDVPDCGAEWDRAYDRHMFEAALRREVRRLEKRSRA